MTIGQIYSVVRVLRYQPLDLWVSMLSRIKASASTLVADVVCNVAGCEDTGIHGFISGLGFLQ